MTTPAIRHQQRVLRKLAEQRASAALVLQQTETINKVASDYDRFQLLLAGLDVDLKRISNLQQNERDVVKRDELIPQYLPLLKAYEQQCNTAIENGEDAAYTNLVLTQVMIWMFDVGQIDAALHWAELAVSQNQPMPERFKRDLKTFVLDQTIGWAEKELAGQRSVQPYFGMVFNRVIEDQWAVNEMALMKMHKMQAGLLEAEGDTKSALAHYRKAQEIRPKESKVKTKIEKLEKKLADAALNTNQVNDDTETTPPALTGNEPDNTAAPLTEEPDTTSELGD